MDCIMKCFVLCLHDKLWNLWTLKHERFLILWCTSLCCWDWICVWWALSTHTHTHTHTWAEGWKDHQKDTFLEKISCERKWSIVTQLVIESMRECRGSDTDRFVLLCLWDPTHAHTHTHTVWQAVRDPAAWEKQDRREMKPHSPAGIQCSIDPWQWCEARIKTELRIYIYIYFWQ